MLRNVDGHNTEHSIVDIMNDERPDFSIYRKFKTRLNGSRAVGVRIVVTARVGRGRLGLRRVTKEPEGVRALNTCPRCCLDGGRVGVHTCEDASGCALAMILLVHVC